MDKRPASHTTDNRVDTQSDDTTSLLTTMKVPSLLVQEARALRQLQDSDDDKNDYDCSVDYVMGVSQDALDDAARLLKDGESCSFTDEQWRAIANIACWLDIEPLEQAVIRHYKKLLVQDPAVVSEIHAGIADLEKRVDVSLARLVLGESVREGKDACTLAQKSSVWKTVSLGEHSQTVSSFAVLHDGRLASGSLDSSINLWNTVTGACTARLTGHFSMVLALAVLHDGRLASASADNFIKLWNTATKACTATLTGHSSYVHALAVLPDGRLASGSSDMSIKLWETDAHAWIATLAGHSGHVTALAVLPDGRLASGSSDHTIKLWDTATKACTATLTHNNPVMALAVLPDGRLASGSLNYSIKLWDTATNSRTATLRCYPASVTALAVLPDGRLASGSDIDGIKLWNVDTGTCGDTLDCHSQFALAVLPDGRLACGPSGGCIELWDTDTVFYSDTLTGRPGELVTSLVVLSDGRIAVAYEDKSVWVWNHVTCECEAIIHGHVLRVQALAGLPDGRLASGSDDSLVRLWDISTSNCTKLTGHTDKVTALVVLPDGLLASGSWDETIRLWDTAACTTLHTMNCTMAVKGLAVLSDGYLAAHVFMDKVRVWRTSTYDRVPHLDFGGLGVFGTPSRSDDIATWTERLKAAAEHNKESSTIYNKITAFAVMMDCRTVQVVGHRIVKVQDFTLLKRDFVAKVVVNDDRCAAVDAGMCVCVLKEVPSRANVFLALTALGLPSPYILQIMS